MTQTYKDPTAIELMRHGLCPECGNEPEEHTDDPRFWLPRALKCDLMMRGVADRIAKQREIDAASGVEA